MRSYIYYKQHSQKLIKINDIHNRVYTVPLDSIAGFCNCDKHKGTLTIEALEYHDCYKKRCPFLVKYSDFPYWHVIKKESIKRKKTCVDSEQAIIDKIKVITDLLVIRLSLNIVIFGVRKAKKNVYIINYVSDYNGNDWSEFSILLGTLKYVLPEYTYFLKHIKTPDGSFLTIKDVYSKKEKNVSLL